MSIMSPYAWDRYKKKKQPQPTMGGNSIGMSDKNYMGQTMRQQNSPVFGSMKQSSRVNSPIRKKSIFG